MPKIYKTSQQMESLAEKILKAFQERESIILIGSTDEGKTYFAQNFLIKYLRDRGINTSFFSSIDELDIDNNLELVIIDEVELLEDKEFLEQEHPEEKPYYPESYLETIKNWYKKLSGLKIPGIFLVTRNTEKEINYVKENITLTGWNSAPVLVLEYKN